MSCGGIVEMLVFVFLLNSVFQTCYDHKQWIIITFLDIISLWKRDMEIIYRKGFRTSVEWTASCDAISIVIYFSLHIFRECHHLEILFWGLHILGEEFYLPTFRLIGWISPHFPLEPDQQLLLLPTILSLRFFWKQMLFFFLVTVLAALLATKLKEGKKTFSMAVLQWLAATVPTLLSCCHHKENPQNNTFFKEIRDQTA